MSVEPPGRTAIVEGLGAWGREHVFRISVEGDAPPVALTSGPGVHRAEADHGVTVITSSVAASGATVEAVLPDGSRLPIASEAEKPSLEPTTVLEQVPLQLHSVNAAITRPRAF